MIRVKVLGPSKGARDGGARALVIPGAGYTVQAPVLYWSIEALIEEGFRVHVVEWDFDEGARADSSGFVSRAVDAALEAMGGLPDLVVAKSIGSLAAPRFVADGVPGVWWTPLLQLPEVVDSLRIASADHLAIGGSEDESWHPEALAGSFIRTVTVDGATHSLETPSRGWRASLAEQTQLLSDVSAHVRGLGLTENKE